MLNTLTAHPCRTFLAVAVAILGGFVASAVHSEDSSKVDLKPLLKEVTKLVEKHYPEAKFTLNEQTIHFEFNVRKFMIHTRKFNSGEWQDASEALGPQGSSLPMGKTKGGICGDIKILSGTYQGMAAAQTFNRYYYQDQFILARSDKLDSHLKASLKYPDDVSKEFLKDFEALVHDFERHLLATAK